VTRIAVIDYGMGNLRSVAKALEHVAPSATVEVTGDPDRVLAADRVVFPGQGAMPDCMRELDSRHLRPAIHEAACNRPFLGLCIGLQMLFDMSEEGPTAGLGILSGHVRRFPEERLFSTTGERLKVPHMGWNEVNQTARHTLWQGIPDGSRFYFVHSYYVQESDSGIAAATTSYPFPFTSAICRDNVFAVQFHPEKSASAGLTLLGNFVHWNP
jgi:glutamine amidotransferase